MSPYLTPPTDPNERQAELGRAYSSRENLRDAMDAAIRLHRASPTPETEARLMDLQRRYTEAATWFEILEVQS